MLVPTVLRGNAVRDAPRRLPRPLPGDAERPRRHSHAERGNEGTASRFLLCSAFTTTRGRGSNLVPTVLRGNEGTASRFLLCSILCQNSGGVGRGLSQETPI